MKIDAKVYIVLFCQQNKFKKLVNENITIKKYEIRSLVSHDNGDINRSNVLWMYESQWYNGITAWYLYNHLFSSSMAFCSFVYLLTWRNKIYNIYSKSCFQHIGHMIIKSIESNQK